LAAFSETLHGGDAVLGRKLVYEQGLGQCMICHKIEGKGGIVAPDLSFVASHRRSSFEYLLESIVNPSAYVVPGYGNMTLNLKDGNTIIASLVSKNENEVVLKMPNGKNKIYPLTQVESMSEPLSSMPPMGTILNKRDLRDIMAYLKSLKKQEH
jgi:putative heme-binding domain-containing protein